MEYSAIYHDMDKRFCYAIDKDLFVIRVQVKKDDMKEIILHCEDKYIPMERKDTKKTILMKKIDTTQFHDYYEAQLQMHQIFLRNNLRCRTGQQIRSCIRFFRPVLQHHNR